MLKIVAAVVYNGQIIIVSESGVMFIWSGLNWTKLTEGPQVER